jgi:hypothetical protein
MSDVPDTAIYARLSDDKTTVIEYPVLALNIRNRAHPFDWYTKVVSDPRPEVKRFHTVKETLKIVSDTVFVSFSLVPDTLNQILASLYRDKNLETPADAPQAPVLFEDLDTETVSTVKDLAEKYAQEKMDAFAAQKGYDSIHSACSYFMSSLSVYKADAQTCINIRDAVWPGMHEYFNKITTGELAVPKSTGDIDAVLPEMTW